MTEFRYIFLSQILTIAFLVGIVLGTQAGYPVYHTRIVKVMPEQIYPEYVMERAMRFHGIPVATKEGCGDWIGIDKKGRPFKIFIEVN